MMRTENVECGKEGVEENVLRWFGAVEQIENRRTARRADKGVYGKCCSGSIT